MSIKKAKGRSEGHLLRSVRALASGKPSLSPALRYVCPPSSPANEIKIQFTTVFGFENFGQRHLQVKIIFNDLRNYYYQFDFFCIFVLKMATFRRNMVGDLSGSVGSITFSKNRSGGIVKFKSTNNNKNSIKQAQGRNSFSQSNGGWHTLTDEQKMLWTTKFANNNKSGMNEFISRMQIAKILKSNILKGTGISVRLNNSAAVFNASVNFNFSKLPNPKKSTFFFNRNSLSYTGLVAQNGIDDPINYREFLFYVSRNKNYTNSIFPDFSNSIDSKLFLAVYYFPPKTQESESKKVTAKILFSTQVFYRSNTLSLNLSFVRFRISTPVFNSLVENKNIRGRLTTFRAIVYNEYFDSQIVGDFNFQFS